MSGQIFALVVFRETLREDCVTMVDDSFPDRNLERCPVATRFKADSGDILPGWLTVPYQTETVTF
jgi:hypothetical protein